MDRHHGLDLTFEQAENVYQFEQDRDRYSDKYYFSFWEEGDYDLTAFKEILNDEQLKKYGALSKENEEQYKRSLIEEDSEKTNEILYNQELLDYYENQFLPDIFKSPLIELSWLNDKSKIEYLRAEYKRVLNDTKKELLTTHFRNYRSYKPNELKLSLLRHKLSCVLPDYGYFKHQMDQPTRVVADYLEPKTQHLPEELEQLLVKKYDALKEFNGEKVKKYFADINNGWHVTIALTQKQEKEYRSMSLLLLDREHYG